tara:strand:- start:183 stop:383 length:201 start_codon:yes stop_codon:yes gene_type:complete
MIKKINPVARDMLRNRKSPQVVPDKKKNVKPSIEESLEAYQSYYSDDDPHDEMLPPLKPKKKGKTK